MAISTLINGKKYEFSDYLDYITKLEQLCVEIEKRNLSIIKVSKSEVKISGQEPSQLRSKEVETVGSRVKRNAPIESRPYQGRITPSQDIRIVSPISNSKPKAPNVTQSTVMVSAPKEITTPAASAINNGKLTSTFPSGKYPATYKSVRLDEEYDMMASMRRSEPIVFESSTPRRVDNTYANVVATEENVVDQQKGIRIDSGVSSRVDIVKAQEEEMSLRPKRTKVDKKRLGRLRQRFNIAALSLDDTLSEEESRNLKSPIVLVPTALNNRSESNYYENVEMIKSFTDGTKIGALVFGKATTMEKIPGEIKKITKLCNDTVDSGLICYEITDKNMVTMSSEELVQAFGAINQLCDILANEGYKILLSADLDLRNRIIAENLSSKYPFLVRITSKELDRVDDNTDMMLMDSATETDEALLMDETVDYLRTSDRTLQASSLRKAA